MNLNNVFNFSTSGIILLGSIDMKEKKTFKDAFIYIIIRFWACFWVVCLYINLCSIYPVICDGIKINIFSFTNFKNINNHCPQQCYKNLDDDDDDDDRFLCANLWFIPFHLLFLISIKKVPSMKKGKLNYEVELLYFIGKLYVFFYSGSYD